MNQSNPEVTQKPFRDQLQQLRARRALILVVTAVTAAVALGYSLTQKPTYDATPTFTFQHSQQDLALLGAIPTTSLEPEKDAAAQASTVLSDPVVRAVQASVGSTISLRRLRSAVHTSVEPSSNLIDIEASTGNAILTAQLANAFAREAATLLTRQERSRFAAGAVLLRRQGKAAARDPSTQQLYSASISRLLALSTFANPVSIVRAASVPGAPASPKPARDGFLGLVLGLVLGVLAAVTRSALDRRFNDSHDVEAQLNLPLVGHLHAETLGRGAIPKNGTASLSDHDLEAFRIMRSNVRFLDIDRGLKVLLVTSAVADEGKSTTAAGIAYANAVAGVRTLLVECDLRRPVLASRLGVNRAPGLTDYLVDDAAPQDILQVGSFGSYENGSTNGGSGMLPDAKLPCITAGNTSPRPAELLGSQRFRQFLSEVRKSYELIVVDSAPLLPVGDTLELLPEADCVLLCVRVRSTSASQALSATRAVQHFPTKPIGLVVTGLKPGVDLDYYEYYGYGRETPRKRFIRHK